MIKGELVSVIIPTYNRESVIARAVRSVLQQSYTNLECIVVDDCSTDNTQKVVEQINDSRIVYIKLTNNLGPSLARNIGVKKANGNIIAFQDSDDVWHPDKLELQMEKLNGKPGYDMVYCAYFYHTNGRKYKVPSTAVFSEKWYFF